jgi:5-(carboxyamino)imidazole ribonucleotide mutase
MAAAILATTDDALAERLETWRETLSASIPEVPSDE